MREPFCAHAEAITIDATSEMDLPGLDTYLVSLLGVEGIMRRSDGAGGLDRSEVRSV